MRKSRTALTLAAILTAGATATSSLYAQDSHETGGSMMGGGMAGMSMMKMMRQMTQMMDHCNGMMNRSRPNEKWRENRPPATEKNG